MRVSVMFFLPARLVPLPLLLVYLATLLPPLKRGVGGVRTALTSFVFNNLIKVSGGIGRDTCQPIFPVFLKDSATLLGVTEGSKEGFSTHPGDTCARQ